ncbi:MAG: ribonuclease HII [Spirochaetales bacterium]|nr:ribonuclease HII [Spirochaetales bacterium]
MICGIDEAGRGPIAGPVCAAAVVFKADCPAELFSQLNDSKKLTEAKRLSLAIEIKKHSFWGVGWFSHSEIDRINIHWATLSAMKKAYKAMRHEADIAYVDGKFTPEIGIDAQAIVKGDSLVKEIMAASIIAKTERDNLMQILDNRYPGWEFKKNKGYPTKRHKELCQINGISPYHRLSFKRN